MWLPSSKFQEANKEKYDEFLKTLTEVDDLDEELREKFWNHLKKFLQEELKRKEPHDLKWSKDTQMSEILGEFKNGALDQLSDGCMRNHLNMLVTLMWHIWGHFDYIINSDMSKKNQHFEIQSNFKKDRGNIPLLLKYKLLNRQIANMGTSNLKSDMKTVFIDRPLAKQNSEKGLCDDESKWSVFGTVSKTLTKESYRGMNINDNNSKSKAWHVVFIGESALDDGGLFSESLADMSTELHSAALPLFIPCPNQANNVGDDGRDKWLINPSANKPHHETQFRFLGAVMGMSIRSGVLFYINIAPYFWKRLVSEQPGIDDLQYFDHVAVQNIKSFQKMRDEGKPEKELTDLGVFMTCKLSARDDKGRELDLVPNGSTTPVTYANLDQYCQLFVEARLEEAEEQIKWIKQGMDVIFKESFLRIFSWRELEKKIIGDATFDLEYFKAITDYRDCDENTPTVKLFWKVLESFTNSDREQYLRFVWGRTRLPLKEMDTLMRHCIQLEKNKTEQHMPSGKTCYF